MTALVESCDLDVAEPGSIVDFVDQIALMAGISVLACQFVGALFALLYPALTDLQTLE